MAAPIVGTGRTLGADNATSDSKFINFPYTASTVTQAIWVAPIACVVTAIQGRTRVAGSGGTCTFKFYKCGDAVAAASGTLLHSGSFNVEGTADTNQYLTLVTDAASLQMAPGDSLNLVLTGTPTSAVGVLTVTVEPLN